MHDWLCRISQWRGAPYHHMHSCTNSRWQGVVTKFGATNSPAWLGGVSNIFRAFLLISYTKALSKHQRWSRKPIRILRVSDCPLIRRWNGSSLHSRLTIRYWLRVVRKDCKRTTFWNVHHNPSKRRHINEVCCRYKSWFCFGFRTKIHPWRPTLVGCGLQNSSCGGMEHLLGSHFVFHPKHHLGISRFQSQLYHLLLIEASRCF